MMGPSRYRFGVVGAMEAVVYAQTQNRANTIIENEQFAMAA